MAGTRPPKPRSPRGRPSLGDVSWAVTVWVCRHTGRALAWTVRTGVRNTGRLAVAATVPVRIIAGDTAAAVRRRSAERALYGLRTTLVTCGGCDARVPLELIASHLAEHDGALPDPARFSGRRVRAAEPRRTVRARAQRLDRPVDTGRVLGRRASRAALRAQADTPVQCPRPDCGWEGTGRDYERVHVRRCLRESVARQRRLAVQADRARPVPTSGADPVPVFHPVTPPQEIAVIDPSESTKNAEILAWPALSGPHELGSYFQLAAQGVRPLSTGTSGLAEYMRQANLPSDLQRRVDVIAGYAQAIVEEFETLSKESFSRWSGVPDFSRS